MPGLPVIQPRHSTAWPRRSQSLPWSQLPGRDQPAGGPPQVSPAEGLKDRQSRAHNGDSKNPEDSAWARSPPPPPRGHEWAGDEASSARESPTGRPDQPLRSQPTRPGEGSAHVQTTRGKIISPCEGGAPLATCPAWPHRFPRRRHSTVPPLGAPLLGLHFKETRA